MRILIDKGNLELLLEKKGNNYTHTQLLKDIEGLDMIQHNHSLLLDDH